MRVIQPIVLVVVAAAAGCSDGASSGWTFTEQKSSGGVPHVVNVPPASGIVATWVVEPELRIGQVEGTDPDVFGQVKGVAVDSHGRMIVFDASAQELRVFGPDGAHLRTMGKKGGGPGEFSGANGLVIGPDDVVRVFDHENQRISLFHADSGFIRSFPIDVRSYGWVWEAMLDTAQTLWYENTIAHDSGYSSGLKGYDSRGVWTDTVVYAPRSAMGATVKGAYTWQRGTARGIMQVPYWPMETEALDPRGYIWRKGATNDYRIARTTLSGDTVLIIESQRPLVPVSQTERDSVIESVRKTAGEQDWSQIPTQKPLVRQMFVSADGDLWVLVTAPDPATSTYDVFGEDGRFKGTAVVNGRVYWWLPPYVRDDQLWAAVQGEFDVTQIVRGRLTRAPN